MSSGIDLPVREGHQGGAAGAGGGAGGGAGSTQGEEAQTGATALGALTPAGDEVCNYEYSYDDLFTERLRAAGQPVTHLQEPLPAEYVEMSPADLDARIARARAALGERVMILGHHYQRDEIIKFADARGDSYKLSQLAAERGESEFIVFCGVHFMAESADILSAPHQQVILPNLAAGCSMADMAPTDDVLDCWDELRETLGPDHGIIPVTYMNSAAALKAFCGKNGGVVCTSSNAGAVLAWALERGKRILFFPDQHLGRNTALAMGYTLEDTAVWAPGKPLGGNTPEALQDATFLLWKGHCSVHGRFRPEQVLAAREQHPGVRVVVHPECTREVVALADCNGSTEYIIKVVTESPPGSVWAVGTEINLVNRLQKEQPDKTIFCLDPVICPCSTMYRIHPAYLAWALDNLVAGRVVNRVQVDQEVARWARVALDRMLQIN
ncbi:MAG TPA: quinolinate synthase NadA [Chloroflexota bacterium]|nr:quinolinate synthase NadA [Chloroflexota bacterium]